MWVNAAIYWTSCLFDGLEVNVVTPTMYDYIETFENEPNVYVYGVAETMFWVSFILFGVIISYWAKIYSVRHAFILSILIAAIGNILYVFAGTFKQYGYILIISARFLGGVSAANFVLFYIWVTTSVPKARMKFLILTISTFFYYLGYTIGGLFIIKRQFEIFSIQINDLNLPMILLFFLALILLFLVLFVYQEKSNKNEKNSVEMANENVSLFFYEFFTTLETSSLFFLLLYGNMLAGFIKVGCRPITRTLFNAKIEETSHMIAWMGLSLFLSNVFSIATINGLGMKVELVLYAAFVLFALSAVGYLFVKDVNLFIAWECVLYVSVTLILCTSQTILANMDSSKKHSEAFATTMNLAEGIGKVISLIMFSFLYKDSEEIVNKLIIYFYVIGFVAIPFSAFSFFMNREKNGKIPKKRNLTHLEENLEEIKKLLTVFLTNKEHFAETPGNSD